MNNPERSLLYPTEITEIMLTLEQLLKLYPVREFAKKLGFSVSTIYNWTTRGKYPSREAYNTIKTLASQRLTDEQLQKIQIKTVDLYTKAAQKNKKP